jgi:hypothetical protein
MNYPYQMLFVDIRLAKQRLETVLDSACGATPERRLTEDRISERFSSKRFFSQESDSHRTIPRATAAEAI